ncbi:hypothetical protein GF327_01740 [Candidatus Woesearchaeota archaeon]|nr:hypothetical protein [Candidatus Woesearchaeota archaeon]
MQFMKDLLLGYKMKKIIQLGLGNIGIEVIRQFLKLDPVVKSDFKYKAVMDSKNCIFKKNCLDDKDLRKLIDLKLSGKLDMSKYQHEKKKLIDSFGRKTIIVDVTASDETYPVILECLKNSGSAVLANKKLLAGEQKRFDVLKNASDSFDRIKFECSVGAGLPIIYSLKSLIKTNDKIKEIRGCFSGTLGYVFSELENGKKFSEIVRKAKDLGYTEPDPREDLSGKDVARKALILARLSGKKLELSDVKIDNLVPEKLRKCTVEEFLNNLSDFDKVFEKRIWKALVKDKRMRYTALVSETRASAGVIKADKYSEIGSLKGTLNMCVIRTRRYDNPLIIQGPGAGVKVTADGVLRNILEFKTSRF